ncbi:AraC family transcriptional regulator [Paenibacillus aceris]|uniref:AraC-like DNA-binding protein n=1 Tax=Paenibacillus aceris TaxID=869555 RepID=A0ABS4HW26_9BACL|nr:AraC family transcriptional regulator [Paenibacillus aceris]MBP1962832.1 AraC-like DNA-binding protein [Paenibacillus aceris]NHW38260.1 AraC family transcriptional regulator [Paenibacillus aceris]
MNLEQISPFIRVAMDSIIETPWTITERVIWDYELLFLMEGNLEVTVEGQTYEGSPGDVFFFKPNERHTICSKGSQTIRQPHIHFDINMQPDSQEVTVSFKSRDQMSEKEQGWFRDDLLSSHPYVIPHHFRPRDPARFEQLLFDVITEYETKPPYYEFRVKSGMLDLLAHLLREQYYGSRTNKDGQFEFLSEIRTYIDIRVNQPVTLEELTNKFHVSKFHLIHLFKNMFQMTPIQYHQHIRMERAKNMIQFSNTPISQIADQLGFTNIHTFSRAFKTVLGQSPSQFRSKS